MAAKKQVEAKSHRHVSVFHLPFDHQPGMRVPKGGSMCKNCEYLKDAEKGLCGSHNFIAWNGSDVIPGKIDEYCSDWFEPAKKEK